MVYSGITFRGSSSGQVVQSEYHREVSLEPDEVVIKVTHSGVCGTDLHFNHRDMVLGHEGVGIVIEAGAACKALKPGDRVGWGYTYWSCGRCNACLTAHESYCPMAGKYGVHDLDQGSFGNLAIKKEQWVFAIPDGIETRDAPPLFCAGSSVFSPLLEFCKPTDRIGIVGCGGLGHLAIQFAAKMGCDVVVLSTSAAKRTDAMFLGAREFYTTKDVQDFTTLGITKPFDALLITSGAPDLEVPVSKRRSPKWDFEKYYKLLKPLATIIPLTISTSEAWAIPCIPTVANGIKIVGTTPASILSMIQTLEFAARNNIRPIVEEFPMSVEGVREALARLSRGEVRYRAVLSWPADDAEEGELAVGAAPGFGLGTQEGLQAGAWQSGSGYGMTTGAGASGVGAYPQSAPSEVGAAGGAWPASSGDPMAASSSYAPHGTAAQTASVSQPAYPAQQQPAYPAQQQPAYPAQQQTAYPAQQQPAYPAQVPQSYPPQQPVYPTQQQATYSSRQSAYSASAPAPRVSSTPASAPPVSAAPPSVPRVSSVPPSGSHFSAGPPSTSRVSSTSPAPRIIPPPHAPSVPPSAPRVASPPAHPASAQPVLWSESEAYLCGRCGERKCRSYIDGNTTFVTCTNCGNRWNF